MSSELPWPLDTGGKIRTFHLHRALAKKFHVRLVTPVREPSDEKIAHLKQEGIEVIPVAVNRRRALNELGNVITSCLSGKPYVLYHRHALSQVRSALLAAAKQHVPDELYLDHLDSHYYRSTLPHISAILDLHNVYSLIIDRYAQEQRNPIKKLYFQREAKLLRRIEKRFANDIDTTFAVSPDEVVYYQNLNCKHVHLVPNGVDCSVYEKLPTGRCNGNLNLLFLGTMSWGPNTNAARYLIEHVLPQIRQKRPAAQLWIVGRNPPHEIVAHHEKNGVYVTGGVPDIVPYFEKAQFLVVPLESGGGTRIKILEAFAAGLPVVSTQIGVEGINAVDGEHLTIVDRIRMASRIIELHAQNAQTYRLATNARVLVQTHYDWNVIGRQAVTIIQQRHATLS